MKKSIVIFGLLIGLTIISCSQNDLNRDSNLSVNTSKINQVLNVHDYESQKLMYISLTSEEKFNLWNNKLDVLLQNDFLNMEQKNLLKDLKKELFVDFFDSSENNDKAEIFKNIYIKDFLHKASKIFTADYIHNNFYTISNNSQNKVYYGVSGCTCNIGATFTCTYHIECKSLKTCRESSSGCGFLMAFECNGNCDVLNPN